MGRGRGELSLSFGVISDEGRGQMRGREKDRVG